MIVPMLKYSFLVFHAEYAAFLDGLRELGVVHIQKKQQEPTPEMQELFRKHADLLRTIKMMDRYKTMSEQAIEPTGYSTGESVLERIGSIESALELKLQTVSNLEKEEKQALPWGAFSYELIEKLKREGLSFRFLICQIRRFLPQWESEYALQIIGDHEGYRYFVKIDRGDEVNESFDLEGVDEVKMPARPLTNIREELDVTRVEVETLRGELSGLAVTGKPLLAAYAVELEDLLSEADARLQTSQEAEGAVSLVEGWVPETKAEALEADLDNKGVLYLKVKGRPEDHPPVLLKNNRFAKLFEMIGNLYSLPNYGELDLTPYLAPFYLLFFGFCFSDAGYGLLFVLVATIFKMKKPESKAILTLIQLFGASTMLFGFLGGTFFGIELYKTNLPFYSSIAQAYGTVENPIDKVIQDIMFKSSLALGLIQILFGMFLRVVKTTRQSGFKYAISTLSWALLIIVSGVNYFLASKEIVAFGNPLYVGFASLFGIGIFFLNTPGKSLLLNFGVGLWDAYNTLVGGIGDLLSYVRLFALGLASAILGLVFNDLALKLVDPEAGLIMQGVGILLMLLVLIAGHAINIFMSGLGSLVHPLRLTFVEFYKNAGFEGGGKAYNPFRKQKVS